MSTSARACAQVPTYVAVTAMAIVMTHSLAVCDAVVFKMNDPGILYSPYNWGVTVDGAKTINPGAYFSTIFQVSALCCSDPNHRRPLDLQLQLSELVQCEMQCVCALRLADCIDHLHALLLATFLICI